VKKAANLISKVIKAAPLKKSDKGKKAATKIAKIAAKKALELIDTKGVGKDAKNAIQNAAVKASSGKGKKAEKKNPKEGKKPKEKKPKEKKADRRRKI